jgi:predicted AlkP superfamily phosphohydrolase/phosphomutase
MLNIEKRRENSKFRKINLHLIKENIKNIMCNWIRPGNLNDTYAQLVEIMSDVVKFKSWFNMFPVVFLMKEKNSFYPKVFDSIYKSLNSKAEMNVIEIDYFKCMKMMFSIESFLIN